MIRILRPALTALVLAHAMLAQAQALKEAPPQFRDYATTASHQGPAAPTRLVTEADRAYRTRLREASTQTANFAGDHVLTAWGCGVNCVHGAAVSLRTGQVTFLPGTVCCWNGEGDKLSFRPNSRLLVTAGLMNEAGIHGAHFWEFTGQNFRLIKTVAVQDTPNAPSATNASPAISTTRPRVTEPTDTQSDLGWIRVAETDDSMWHVQPGSLTFNKNKGGTAIALVVGKITNRRSRQIELYKWYVAGADCRRKMGKVVALNINDSFQFENDFVFGSGNVASTLAETICGAASQSIQSANDSKGL